MESRSGADVTFAFEWSELVTDEVLETVCDVAGADVAMSGPRVQELIERIVADVGGLPFTANALPLPERTALGARLLAEAVRHYGHLAGQRPPAPGWIPVRSTSPDVAQAVHALAVVDVNRANVRDLDTLPGIGPERARAILDERANGGWFASLEELVARVDGVGEGALETLRTVTYFGFPAAPPPAEVPGEPPLAQALRAALPRFSSVTDAGGRLIALLEAVQQVTAREPHPATRDKRLRHAVLPGATADVQASVGILDGNAYHEFLPGILGSAQSSIRVAMFHAALPGPQHPTRALLDALIDAHGRGVDVRVLLDSDRSTDPYLSTVINSAAKRYLEEAGVACRFDDEAHLLHSKYVVVDAEVAVVGSHNWSAGSYFRFDDVSIVVRSNSFAGELVARFDRLWG